MTLKNQRSFGGLVLNTNEIKQILKESGTVGVAFQVPNLKSIVNVDLKVFRVYSDEEWMYGEERILNYKVGAKGYNKYPVSIDECQFEFVDKLISDKFSFAYISKDRFNELFQKEEDEVFIVGSKSDYGNLGHFDGNWFTLTIFTRINPQKDTSGFKLPPFYQMQGCPPVWTHKGADEKSTPVDIKKGFRHKLIGDSVSS